MLPFTIVAAATAVFVVAFTKPKRSEPAVRSVHAPLAELESSSAKLKAAAREVDNSAAAVEVALKPLMAGI